MPFQLLAAVHPREPQSRLQMLRRGELLDAAVAVIGEKGLSGLTLARVAARVGMSAASVNFHFDSKINLLRDTLHAVVQEFHNTITTVIASHPADPLEALEAIVAAQFEPYERIVLEFDETAHVVASRGSAPKGDDPNDVLLQDFRLQELMGKAGRDAYKRYRELRKRIRRTTGDDKDALVAEAADLGERYGFEP